MAQDNLVIYVIFGLLLRVGIPVGITVLLGWFIRRLDAKWKKEAKVSQRFFSTTIREPGEIQPCWEFMDCHPSIQANCPIYGQNEIPCWEYFRENGALRPSCQVCTYRKTTLIKQNQYAMSIGD